MPSISRSYGGISKKRIIIDPCPLCKSSHTYELKIVKSPVVYREEPLPDPSFYRSHKVSFTRLFSCPKTSKDFQASFFVWESFGEAVSSVDVEGLSDEAQDK